MIPYVETVMLIVQFAQDEIMIRTRSFRILILPVSLRTRFPRPDFHGQTPLIRTTIMDEYGVGFFSTIIIIKHRKSFSGLFSIVKPNTRISFSL